MDTFKDRFKQLRNEKQLTQDKIAEKFYLKKSSISKYETGKQTPTIELFIQFADFFGVSTDYLWGRSEIRNPENISIEAAETVVYKSMPDSNCESFEYFKRKAYDISLEHGLSYDAYIKLIDILIQGSGESQKKHSTSQKITCTE